MGSLRITIRTIEIAGLLALLLWPSLAALPRIPQSEDQVALGLVLATPEQLRGVPLAFTPYSGTELPGSVDLSASMPPVGHQGKQNSCVAWALAYALKSYEESIEEKQPFFQAGRLDFNRVFSPAFIYNQINQGRNAGVPYIEAFRIVTEQGAATWADMPYSMDDWGSQPSLQARTRAKRYRIGYWRQVNIKDGRELKAHLQAGFPILIGANVDRAFIGLPAGSVWNSIGDVVGGHAMVVVGYDDGRKAFRLMNSWGPQWADGGYCWVDYDHFSRVVNEGYVVMDAVNGPAPEDKPDSGKIAITRPAALQVTNIQHNAYYPNRLDMGYFMKFEGSIDIPAGLGLTDQIVVYFYWVGPGGQRGVPVRSLNQAYADPYGSAACGTAVYPVPPEGLKTPWQCWIPYTALDVPAGGWFPTETGNVYRPAQTSLLAEAVLFVNGFGVAKAPLYSFLVNR